ncbi:Glutaredoxin-like protein C5orf63 [Neolecta irregularis DAH-3]|uniref:Glutaredoxin-like protein n=1 Tax=Neolecta irregularis (strain DAH-3) TaxID=1198029 RepID=A0A1U7LP13_NEOID|nr:Glutaredoxin-like protein C5orf63 [Neolecta irregularis DAH-3]|eukprot:OLL24395.1 Glutaredoxin-like protein C5orf63 [Neolecta irregularis DAH-3]
MLHRIPRLALFSHPSCSLCHSAKTSILNVRNRIPFEFEEINIKLPKNKKFHDMYAFDVPVLHINDEEKLMHKITEQDLEKQLNNLD